MRVLIADDEIIIREGMANVIPWNDYGLTLLRPAASAEEVIERLDDEKPDILITDIQMNDMNGLELVAYLGENEYQIESILLTGYDDFHFIQEAIRQDVCDYLLKTSSPEEIITAVKRAKKRLEKDKEYSQWKESEQEQLNRMKLEKLIAEGLDYHELMDVVDVIPELAHPPFQLLYMDIELELETLRKYEALWNSYLFGKWFTHENALLIVVKRDPYLADDYLLQMAIKKVNALFHKPILASEVVTTLSSIRELYSEITSLQLFQWILVDCKLIQVEHIRQRKGIVCDDTMEENLQHVISLIKMGDKSKLEEWIREIVHWLFSHPQATPDSIQFYVQNLYMEVIKYVDQMAGRMENYRAIPSASEWFKQPIPILFALFQILLTDFHTHYQKHANYVEETIYYIDKHLGQAISLNDVANHIQIHPNYLSELIRKRTGRSYIGLLTELRMKKATEFLQHSSIAINHIAKRVGYNDRKYFTKQFKKKYGYTPTQYRRKHDR
ncbi:MAG: response regulator transcription factor [Bacillota bacterium]|uniref:response regulator n=1 Tax=Virgibacillus salarius TaxID=447199 RepID=UPI00248F831F|nr:response regulator [Virgibacillus salarius]WBX78661.1 response regulator [Virgibacillus salarius]